MRTLALQLALYTALLAWRLRKRGAPRPVLRATWIVGGGIALLTLPHTLWDWQVQQHLPAAFLGVQMSLAAAWFFFALPVGLGLWVWDGATFWLRRKSPPTDPGRRRLVTQAPLALGLLTPLGVVGGEHEPLPTTRRIASPQLPAAFDGFRILQISDLHLGPVLGLDWLERALARAANTRIDLVAVTGDLSDDLELIGPALARIAALPSAHGHVIIPGNHEYYVGIERFLREVRASPVKLFTGEAMALSRGAESIQLLGIDYPHRRFVKDAEQFQAFLDGVLAKAAPGFRVLLSHHPDAFDLAADRGVDVQLSGHTHGGQINIFGQSILVGWLKYPRGHYVRGKSQLYVTTGLGHWLPFRVDCPTELPIIELARG